MSLLTNYVFVQEGYHTFRGGFWNYFSMGKSCSAYCLAYISDKGCVPFQMINIFHIYICHYHSTCLSVQLWDTFSIKYVIMS